VLNFFPRKKPGLHINIFGKFPYWKSSFDMPIELLPATLMTRAAFHKSWAYGVKHKAHPNLGENAISWAYGANT
jgi:hypothetical protein